MGMRWVGKLELEFGSGGGAGNGGASRSWSAMVLRESGLHPCIRSLAWRTCEAELAKWMEEHPAAERRRARWRSWLRWPWAGNGTRTIVMSSIVEFGCRFLVELEFGAGNGHPIQTLSLSSCLLFLNSKGARTKYLAFV